jgi:hypothetical protein
MFSMAFGKAAVSTSSEIEGGEMNISDVAIATNGQIEVVSVVEIISSDIDAFGGVAVITSGELDVATAFVIGWTSCSIESLTIGIAHKTITLS